MHAKFALAILLLLAIDGCSSVKTRPGKPAEPTETVLIVYHVIPGHEEELGRRLASAWAVYQKERLVVAQPHIVVRDKEAGGKNRFVEVFTWINAAAPDHAPRSVKSIWEQMSSCCEQRDGHPGIEGGEVALVEPAAPSMLP